MGRRVRIKVTAAISELCTGGWDAITAKVVRYRKLSSVNQKDMSHTVCGDNRGAPRDSLIAVVAIHR